MSLTKSYLTPMGDLGDLAQKLLVAQHVATSTAHRLLAHSLAAIPLQLLRIFMPSKSSTAWLIGKL